MAGDWIPMRTDLFDDPAVIAIAGALGLDEYAVVGRLLRLWSWANRHLASGEAKGITEPWIDRYVGTPSFAAAMLNAGWLRTRSGGVEFPNFERWNSQGAKKRIEKTRQKQVERSRVPGDKMATTKQTIPRPMRASIIKRDGSKCVNCGWTPLDIKQPTTLPQFDRLSIDHIIPECRGGQTIESNLVTLCMKCNQTKANRTFEEAGMSPDLSHIVGDNMATNQRPEKRREENKDKDPPNPPQPGGTFPANLDTPAFREAWGNWIEERKAKKVKPYTAKGEASQLAKLAEFGTEEAIRAIRDSIAQGYQGLFPKPPGATNVNGRAGPVRPNSRVEPEPSYLDSVKTIVCGADPATEAVPREGHERAS